MKILRVISSIDPRGGGPVEGAHQLNRVLLAMGHDIEFVCLDQVSDEFVQNSSVPVHALGGKSLGYGYSPKLVPWLKENSKKYDIVIVQGIWQYHSFATWRALSGSGTPYVVFTHGMLDPWFKRQYPLKHLKKWVYWPWAEYRVLRDASAVIFTCEEEKVVSRESFSLYKVNEQVTSYGTSQPPELSEMLLESFYSRCPESKGKRVVLFLSRIHEKKGCDLLLKGFAAVVGKDPSFHLVMAGPDKNGLGDQLRTMAEELGILDRISWPGMLEGDAKWGAYYSAEVFALPSHQENFGIVVAEALACAKPVLISNKVNIWREIEKDGAGFVADDTVEGTVANLQRWIGLDASERSAMTLRSQECFMKRFHIERAAERLVEILSAHVR